MIKVNILKQEFMMLVCHENGILPLWSSSQELIPSQNVRKTSENQWKESLQNTAKVIKNEEKSEKFYSQEEPRETFRSVSVQLLSRVQLFVTPWTAAHQASLSIINSQSLLKLMSIELVMPSNHLILCHLLLLLPSIFPSIRVFSNELALRIR